MIYVLFWVFINGDMGVYETRFPDRGSCDARATQLKREFPEVTLVCTPLIRV